MIQLRHRPFNIRNLRDPLERNYYGSNSDDYDDSHINDDQILEEIRFLALEKESKALSVEIAQFKQLTVLFLAVWAAHRRGD